jgi:hypothetical protein
LFRPEWRRGPASTSKEVGPQKGAAAFSRPLRKSNRQGRSSFLSRVISNGSLGQKYFAAASNASHEGLVKHSRAFTKTSHASISRRGSDRSIKERDFSTAAKTAPSFTGFSENSSRHRYGAL